MGKNSCRERLAAQPAASGVVGQGGGVDPSSRTISAIWANDPAAVPIVDRLRAKLQLYPYDLHNRRVELQNFNTKPSVAGGPSGPAYTRDDLDKVSDFVVIFTDSIIDAPLIRSCFEFIAPTKEQKDAAAFWLGAAQMVDIEDVSLGETRMKDFPWQILHPIPPGKFERKDDESLDTAIHAAVRKLREYWKTGAQSTGDQGNLTPKPDRSND